MKIVELIKYEPNKKMEVVEVHIKTAEIIILSTKNLQIHRLFIKYHIHSHFESGFHGVLIHDDDDCP